MAGKFKVVLFMGSARDAPPSWNPSGPCRLGDRVLSFLLQRVSELNDSSDALGFEIDVMDCLSIPEFQTVMSNPTYFKAADQIPDAIKEIQAKIKDADAYLIVTPEYNHSMPSALTNMMNQFGCSLYAYKVIFEYSIAC